MALVWTGKMFTLSSFPFQNGF